MTGLDLLRQFTSFILQEQSAAFHAASRYLWIILPALGALFVLGIILFCVSALSPKDKKIPAPPKRRTRPPLAVSFLSGRLCSIMPLGEKRADADILSLLEEYIAGANAAVQKTGGMFECAADGSFFACWGIQSSSGSPAHDALNAVRAALLIRLSLIELNKKYRESLSAPLTEVIGMSSGKMTAGNIFYDKKRRRVLFGETGILAAKIRDAAEKLVADVVITSKTWRLVKEYVLTEELPSLSPAETKEPVRLFAAINLRAAPGSKQPSPATLSELRKGLYIKNSM